MLFQRFSQFSGSGPRLSSSDVEPDRDPFFKVENFLTNSNKKHDISDCLFSDKIDLTAHGPKRDHPPAWESKSKLGKFEPFPEDRLGPGFSPFCAERLL